MDEKQALRRLVRARCPNAFEQAQQSAAICRHVMAWPTYQAASCVGAYMPLRREANITPLLQDLLERGGVLALPRVEEKGRMTMRRVTSLQALVPGQYGLLEPAPDTPCVATGTLALLLVPLEAIDATGMRLGKGGGYYDRLLETVNCTTLGIALLSQWVAYVPADPWDKPLCAVADARGIHLFPKLMKG